MATSVLPDHPEDPVLVRSRPSVFGDAVAVCKTVARTLQRVEWLFLIAAAPLLLLPSRATAVGVILIATTWVARRVATGRWSIATHIDRFMPLFGIALLVSLIPSVRLDYSAPKFWGVVLGVAALYAVVNTCGDDRALRLAQVVLLLIGGALAVMGLVGMASPPDKLIDDRGIYAALPHLITSVQSSTVVTQGINPNELGGTLVLLIPLACVIGCRPGYARWPALILAVAMSGSVVLTQSRAALLGLLVAGCVGLVCAAGRRGLVAVVVLLGVGAQALIEIDGADHLSTQLFGNLPTAGVESLSGRVELWQRGLAMAADMPLTGIGLNSYPVILQTYYPTILHQPSTVLPHVHDLYLQTLLDFGIPGLVAWLAIVGAAVMSGLVALRGRVHVSLVSGLLLGLLAHATYSLVDAVALGAKPGVLLWVILGLLLAAGARTHGNSATSAQVGPPPRTTGTARFHSRWALAAAAVLLSPFIVGFVALNAATLTLHQGLGTASPILEADLQFAQTFTAGPVLARIYAAQALLAHQRGDTPAELESLDHAAAIGGAWDPSLALRAGDLRLAYGDRPRAIAAWRAAGALQSLLDRAAASPPAQALDWYNLAQAVDPTDWRPYAAAGHLVVSSDPNRAAAMLSEALQLRGDDPARTSLAQRLIIPSSQLATNASIDPSPDDVQLLLDSSSLLLARSDLPGAVFAAQLSTEAAPNSWPTWRQLGNVLDRVGRTTQANEARSHAQSLRP